MPHTDPHTDPRPSRLGLAFFVLLAATLIVQYTTAFVISRWAPALTDAEGYTWLLSLLPIYCIGLPLCLALLRRCPAEPAQVRPMRARYWWLALLLSLGLMFFGNLIGNALMMLVNALRGKEMVNPVQEVILSADPVWTAVATVITAPLGEEFLFRRLIIDRTRRYGELPAVLLSAAMFGAFHLNFYQFFYAFLIGLVFGYVYVKTGRLRYTIALHAAINFLGGVIAPALLRAILPMLEQLQSGVLPTEAAQLLAHLPALLAYLAYSALLSGCAMATLIIGIVAHRRLSFPPGEGGYILRRTPTIIAFFALCAVMAVIALR